jgi:acyl-coenzyme A thioesterase PaaI-like protein
MGKHTAVFITLMRNPWKFRFYLFWKLPMAFLSGLQIHSIDEEQAAVSVPYRWLTQNPFRSTYFACLAMAAEMSTGLLALAQVYKSRPAVSMLVVQMEARYLKKATGITTFSCTEGKKIQAAIEETLATGQSATVLATSRGHNTAGDTIAEFSFTWSFKRK